MLVARLNADGSPDLTFGTNGVVLDSLIGGAFARSVAIQADGRLSLRALRREGCAISPWPEFLWRPASRGPSRSRRGRIPDEHLSGPVPDRRAAGPG